MSSRSFPTLTVATAATGIGLGQCSFSDVQHVIGWVLGHAIWTHELADRDMNARAEATIRTQLPNLPSRELARSDWQAAAAAAIAAYGDTVDLTEGAHSRTEDPISSLARLTGRPEDIIAVAPK